MTTVNAATGSSTSGQTTGRKTGAMQEMGKDAFLQLLVTQLRHQDPLSPQDNSAFVAQMAQFTALEQMQNLNIAVAKLLEQQSNLQAPSLLGRNVTVVGADGEQHSGKVEELEYSLGQPLLMVDGHLYRMDMVQKVFAGEIDE